MRCSARASRCGSRWRTTGRGHLSTMTGSFAVKGEVVISFAGGVELAFCDARRFARVRYLDDVTLQSPIADLGFDALTELPPPAALHTALSKRRAAVKAVLLDQGSGIGNWVADEVLYHARVHPESLAAELDEEASGRLRESIRMVLETAVAANAVSDNYPPDWLFHHRWDVRGSKKEAPSINGHAVAFLKVGGRTSAYLPDLQKRVGSGGAAKPRRKPKAKAVKDEDSDGEEEAEEAPPVESSGAGRRRGGGGRGKKKGGAEKEVKVEEEVTEEQREEETRAEEKPKAAGRGRGKVAKKGEEEVAGGAETAEGGADEGEQQGEATEKESGAKGGRKRKGESDEVATEEAPSVRRGKKEKGEEVGATVADILLADGGQEKRGAVEQKAAPAQKGRPRKGAGSNSEPLDESAEGEGKEVAEVGDGAAEAPAEGGVETKEPGTEAKPGADDKPDTEEKPGVDERTGEGSESAAGKENETEAEKPAEENKNETEEAEKSAGNEQVAGAKRGRGRKGRGAEGAGCEEAPRRKSSRRK